LSQHRKGRLTVAKHATEYEELIGYVNKITFGFKYATERHDVFNKFGLLFDSFKERDGDWIQTQGAEAGKSLINLFEYTNSGKSVAVFVSTSRVGIALLDVSPKSGILSEYQKRQPFIRELCEDIIGVFSRFTFVRFGVHLEILLPENQANHMSRAPLLRQFVGESKATDFNEISHRHSLDLPSDVDGESERVISQFVRVIVQHQGRPRTRFLLSEDYQVFYGEESVRDCASMSAVIDRRFETTYKRLEEHISSLLVQDGERE
jgi:hypothetical protein